MTIPLAKGLVAALLCLGLTACGLKGPLYMPPTDQADTAQPTEPVVDPAETPATGAGQQ